MYVLGLDAAAVDRVAPSLDIPYARMGGEYDHDPDTTNIYVCNLPLDVTILKCFEIYEYISKCPFRLLSTN